MEILLLISFIILILTMSMNLTGIVIHYYFLKSEIEEIENIELQVDLLQDLNSIWSVFCIRVFYHKEYYFFKERRYFSRLIRYRLGILKSPTVYKKKSTIKYAKETTT